MQWMAIAIALGLAAVAATGLARREHLWERMTLEQSALGEFGIIRLPAALRPRPDEADIGADEAGFVFRRVNGTHWNGQTSYAELLRVTVFAPDEAPSSSADSPWTVMATNYDRDPVHEPAWRILLRDPSRRIQLDWLGYKKHYSLDEAKRNLRFLLQNITLHDGYAALFSPHRDWPEDSWKQNFAANAAVISAVMGAVPVGRWRADGPWRYAIDNERPQRLLIAYRLGERERAGEPMDFEGPLTRYRFVHGAWRQDNQGSGGGLIGNALFRDFQAELADPTKDYYYSVETLNLWKPVAAAQIAAARQAALAARAAYRNGQLLHPSPR
ncbi:MAG TPA: hypothetical protein VFQ91_08085 [Bryobacteraceae bacterium]|nr:hypothetical protein [Bryobacteraceae bacterium]